LVKVAPTWVSTVLGARNNSSPMARLGRLRTLQVPRPLLAAAGYEAELQAAVSSTNHEQKAA